MNLFRIIWRCIAIALLPLTSVYAQQVGGYFDAPYVNFESHQHRPVLLSASGTRLYVTNTPDNRIEIFDLTGEAPQHIADVMVGLEPVAVAEISESEIWVVNHLSDSISVVDVSSFPAQVARTIQVGDEPRDIIVGGEGGRRVFISAAHRGQNSPYTDVSNPGQLTTPGVGRADVWVIDAETYETERVLSLFGDSTGPLAVSPDGATVYAGVFKSGNKTTIVGRVLVCPGGAAAEPCEIMPGESVAPGGLPAPNENIQGIAMPESGLIVRWDGEGWKDELDRDWSDLIKLDLPDYDVFAIDANTDKPVQKHAYSGVGTILYAMDVNPVTGDIYVANTEARNEVRFEGVRPDGSDISTVQGHLHETHITRLSKEDQSVQPVHLNSHIDYEQFPVPEPVRAKSLSMPVALTFSADGETMYVAAKGSDKVAVLDRQSIDDNSFVPDTKQHIRIPGGGPAGMALDEARARLYVLNRFDNSLVAVDTNTRKIVSTHQLYSPEPSAVTRGRPLFYNAYETSGNGESSCASCHVAGDKDELAWDLGNPLDVMLDNPSKVLGPLKGDPKFHPMKGPMLTQTMRGVANHGPLHWRGDRTAGNDPGGDPLDVEGAMHKFNVAFVSLMGREKEITQPEMHALTDFSMRIIPPPNPIRALDNSLTPEQQKGKTFFQRGRSVPGGATCSTCHVVNERRGWYGTKGTLTHIIGGRLTKVPHHRNTYERVGMFGRAATPTLDRNGEHTGPQIRGYGFTHDGGADTTIRFMSYPAFRFPKGDVQRRQVEQYLFAFEANLKPVVGQQVTLDRSSGDGDLKRARLLVQQANLRHADLIVRAVIDGSPKAWLLSSEGLFVPNAKKAAAISFDALVKQSAKAPLTLTAVPPGSGYRMALDRDLDGQPD